MNQGGVYRNSKHRVEVRGNKLEIITISGNRVGAGEVLMSVIDVTWSVFGPGLVRVFCRQGKMMLEDVEGCNND